MRTKDFDVVYCVKDDPDNEELRYSLRSLKNLPHQKVWIYGGGPKWLNEEAMKMGVNFSQVLQEALMMKLKVK